jgi:hypothetical protein
MFPSHFVELLAIEDARQAAEQGGTRFLEAAAAGGGFCAIAFRSSDIHADRAVLESFGLHVGPVGRFERAVTLPGGRPAVAVVETTWIEDLRTARFAVFLSQQHVPEAIWVPEWMRHANGAAGLSRVSLIAPDAPRTIEILRQVSDSDREEAPLLHVQGCGSDENSRGLRIDSVSWVTARMEIDLRFGARGATSGPAGPPR